MLGDPSEGPKLENADFGTKTHETSNVLAKPKYSFLGPTLVSEDPKQVYGA